MKAFTGTPNSQFHSAVNSASSRHVQEDHHSHNVHHQHPTSAPPESVSKSSSFTATFRSVFHRLPSRVPSANSLHSSYSAASSAKRQPPPSASDFKPLHPYAAMVSAPLPVVSSHNATEEEDECPVCLEPLSFSFRLPGEKPHIVPECGHALHEVSLRIPVILPIVVRLPSFVFAVVDLLSSPSTLLPVLSGGVRALPHQQCPSSARGASRRALSEAADTPSKACRPLL